MSLKRISLAVLVLCAGLGAAVVGNTLLKPSRQLAVERIEPPRVDADAAARRLAGAVRIQTVSSEADAQLNAAEFDRLHAYLA